MAERWHFWFGAVACLALSVSAIENVRTSGSKFVLALALVAIVVMGVSLFRRRADSGIRFRSTPDDH